MPTQLPHVQEHIDLIARQEKEFFRNRTASERAGDAIAVFVGSLRFVALHLVLFAGWICVNSLRHTRPWHFDPYPFPMLDTVVALEAILMSSFILMRQTRLGRRSDEREHLMLQLLLLTEREVTALLQVNRRIADQLGLREVAQDERLELLSQETPIDQVAEVIREKLPETEES